MLSKKQLEHINTRCERCSTPYHHVERDAGLVTLGKIKYIDERDLRIVECLPSLEMYLIENPFRELIYSVPYTICNACLDELHYEVSEDEIAALADEWDIEVDDILEDPGGHGLTYPTILPELFMVDSEPDICSGCESPFEDDEIVATLNLVDLLDAEPVAVERRHYASSTTFLCKSCACVIDTK